jgi:hypothetical protein
VPGVRRVSSHHIGRQAVLLVAYFGTHDRFLRRRAARRPLIEVACRLRRRRREIPHQVPVGKGGRRGEHMHARRREPPHQVPEQSVSGSSGLVRARQGTSGSSGFVRIRQGSSGRAPIELPLALESFVRRGAKPLGAHTDGPSGRAHVPAAGRRSARRLRVEDAREGRVVLFAHPARKVDLIPVGKGEAPW